MSRIDDSRAHLRKAREFLQAAELNLDLDLFNAATSAAVLSGVNSKDAICLMLTGSTRKSDNHHDAVAELKAAGRVGADLEQTLGRLLRLKTKSQYQAASVGRSDATKAIAWSSRMLEGAERVVSAG